MIIIKERIAGICISGPLMERIMADLERDEFNKWCPEISFVKNRTKGNLSKLSIICYLGIGELDDYMLCVDNYPIAFLEFENKEDQEVLNKIMKNGFKEEKNSWDDLKDKTPPIADTKKEENLNNVILSVSNFLHSFSEEYPFKNKEFHNRFEKFLLSLRTTMKSIDKEPLPPSGNEKG